MPNPQQSPNRKGQRKQSPQNDRDAAQRAPRNPSDPSEGQRQKFDSKRGSEESKGNSARDKFSGEKMPKH